MGFWHIHYAVSHPVQPNAWVASFLPMRIRTLKPEFWQNEKLCALPEGVHYFAAAILNYADDEGFFNANPALIKAALYPLREPSVDITVSLRDLSNQCYLKLGKGSDGRNYGRVVHFKTHQVINKPKLSKIKPLCNIPDELPDEYRTDTVLIPAGTGNREQGTGSMEQGGGTGIADAIQPPAVIAKSPKLDELKTPVVNTSRSQNIPKSVDEVIEVGKTMQPEPKSESACRSFWNYYEGQAKTGPNGELFWVTSSDAVVTNWRNKLAGWDLYGDSKSSIKTTDSVWQVEKCLDDMKTQMAKCRGNPKNPTFELATTEEKERYKRMKDDYDKKRKEVK